MLNLTEELSKTQLLTAEDFDKMPQGYLRFKFRVSIPSLRLSFVNEFEQALFLAEIQNQQAFVEVGKGLTRARFTITTLIIEDKWTGAKGFPNILETKEFENSRVVTGEDSKALVVNFETNDSMVICPFRIEIDT